MCGPLPGSRLLSVYSGSHPDPLPRFVLSTHGWGDFFFFCFKRKDVFLTEWILVVECSGCGCYAHTELSRLRSAPRRCMILPGGPARCSRAWVGAPRCLGLRCPRCSAFSSSLSQTFQLLTGLLYQLRSLRSPLPVADFQADSRAVIEPLSTGFLLWFLHLPLLFLNSLLFTGRTGERQHREPWADAGKRPGRAPAPRSPRAPRNHRRGGRGDRGSPRK